jgi:hypothetical protein
MRSKHFDTRGNSMKRTQKSALLPAQKRRLLFIAAGALVLTVLLANYLAHRNVPSVDPTVSIEHVQDDSFSSRVANVTPNLPDDGEVYRTAERLREASAVALAAVSMSRVNKSTAAILKPLILSSPVYDQLACCLQASPSMPAPCSSRLSQRNYFASDQTH